MSSVITFPVSIPETRAEIPSFNSDAQPGPSSGIFGESSQVFCGFVK